MVLLFISTPFLLDPFCLHNSAKQLRTILKLFHFNQLFKIFDPTPYESYNRMRMKKIAFSSYFHRLVQRSAIDLVTTYGCRLEVHMYIVKGHVIVKLYIDSENLQSIQKPVH